MAKEYNEWLASPEAKKAYLEYQASVATDKANQPALNGLENGLEKTKNGLDKVENGVQTAREMIAEIANVVKILAPGICDISQGQKDHIIERMDYVLVDSE